MEIVEVATVRTHDHVLGHAAPEQLSHQSDIRAGHILDVHLLEAAALARGRAELKGSVEGGDGYAARLAAYRERELRLALRPQAAPAAQRSPLVQVVAVVTIERPAAKLGADAPLVLLLAAHELEADALGLLLQVVRAVHAQHRHRVHSGFQHADAFEGIRIGVAPRGLRIEQHGLRFFFAATRHRKRGSNARPLTLNLTTV
mmetsp:Transcript_952/g.2546  ORF Transcript_952/g.2546 Transcript_952/m.2546 type:complete len:202 (-) Transcript_952:2-607(-)